MNRIFVTSSLVAAGLFISAAAMALPSQNHAPTGVVNGVPGAATTTSGGVPGGQTSTTGVPGSATGTTPVTTAPAVTTGGDTGTIAADATYFTAFDRNGDHFITADEFAHTGLPSGLFNRMDTNHDGKISGAEFDAFGPLPKPQ